MNEIIEHFTHAKVTERRPEKDRGELAGKERLAIERVAGTPDQLDLLAEILVIRHPEALPHRYRGRLSASFRQRHAPLPGGI